MALLDNFEKLITIPSPTLSFVGCGERSEPHRSRGYSNRLSVHDRCGSLRSPHPTMLLISSAKAVSEAYPDLQPCFRGRKYGQIGLKLLPQKPQPIFILQIQEVCQYWAHFPRFCGSIIGEGIVINEHDSSTILKEKIALANDKYSLLEE